MEIAERARAEDLAIDSFDPLSQWHILNTVGMTERVHHIQSNRMGQLPGFFGSYNIFNTLAVGDRRHAPCLADPVRLHPTGELSRKFRTIEKI